jgi:hypothetical protein
MKDGTGRDLMRERGAWGVWLGIAIPSMKGERGRRGTGTSLGLRRGPRAGWPWTWREWIGRNLDRGNLRVVPTTAILILDHVQSPLQPLLLRRCSPDDLLSLRTTPTVLLLNPILHLHPLIPIRTIFLHLHSRTPLTHSETLNHNLLYLHSHRTVLQ